MTKAHVPPQAAGNRERVVSANVRLKDRVLGHGRIAQGGMWFHGLCSECNSMAGAHYDAAYADFSNAMLARVNLQQRLYLPPVRLAPARVARSIRIGMFATSPHLRVMFRGLAEDLRNRRDRITMPDGASLRLAVCLDRRTRLAGMYNAVRVIRHIEHYDVFSEVYFRPLAWALTPNGRGTAQHADQSVVEKQGWAVVDHWLQYSEDRTAADLRSLCRAPLPLVLHPLNGHDRDEWMEFMSDKVTAILEGEIPA
ncbi:hypothetical protein GCM10010423_70410 [Streptomyces levis]|uniref:Uncharacterized protein n=1 Tax=Streptomyces levis TaxID=285566 RepID=A0ABP6BED4_9ACTN